MDWRALLHTVFVDNLSRRVLRSAVWEIFNSYGRVVDVFIPKVTKERRRLKTYAFVRFKYEHELTKAIEGRNMKRIDGWKIVVKRAKLRMEGKNSEKGE
ncbi:hypothetical protein DITRI_Ditri01bG0151400 [Diplodiscus trichospermus]